MRRSSLQALFIGFLVLNFVQADKKNVQGELIWPFQDPNLQWEILEDPSQPKIDYPVYQPKDVAPKLEDSLFNPFDMIPPVIFEGIPAKYGSFFNIFTPWWKGKNVCIERERITDTEGGTEIAETGQDQFFTGISVQMKTCTEYRNKYECIHKTHKRGQTEIYIVRHQCCLGFRRINGGECEKVDLLSLVETIKKFNGTEFLATAKNSGIDLEHQNVTIFLPTDEAINSFFVEALESNTIDLKVEMARRRRQTGNLENLSKKDLFNAHMTPGFQELTTASFYDTLLKNSSLEVKHLLDENHESQYYVNCVKVTSPNNYALNGVVHVVDKFLLPPVMTIYETISRKPEFSILKSILDKTGMAKSLDSVEMWTMFAPTNDAINSLSPHILNLILKGDSCAVNLIKNHLIGSTFCSANVELGATREQSALGETLNFTMAADDNENINNVNEVVSFFRVNEANVIKKDIIATNGIIHVIDKVLVPDGALPVSTLLEKRGLKKFINLVKKAGMMEEIDNLSNVTFFVPTDKAIDDFIAKQKKEDESKKTELQILADEIDPKEFMSDKSPEELKEFIKSHITSGAIQSFDFENNAKINTLDKDATLRVNLYSTNTLSILSNVYNRATVNCARLLYFDIPQCNNFIHLVDRPLGKVTGTIMDRIREDPNLSMLHKILDGTDIEETLKTKENITFVAPTNKAFEALPKSDYDLLLVKKNLTTTVLNNHVMTNLMCGGGIQGVHSMWALTPSLWRSRITTYDRMATNGVMHLTDSLWVAPNKSNSKYPNVDIALNI